MKRAPLALVQSVCSTDRDQLLWFWWWTGALAWVVYGFPPPTGIRGFREQGPLMSKAWLPGRSNLGFHASFPPPLTFEVDVLHYL